jgi:hypothetical protein
MSRSRRALAVLACAASACALSAPAALAAPAAPSNGQGVVLSLTEHGARLVDRAHRVDDVRVRSTRGLRRGDVVSVRNGRARVSGRVRKLSFLGRVVRSSAHGAVVRLGDGSPFKLGGGKPRGHRARSAANVAIDFQGLAPGQTLLITIATDARGDVAITIRVLPAVTDIGDGELHATGIVIDDEGDGGFAIRTDAGSSLRFDDPQRLLEAADAVWCDVVDVSFHKNSRRLIAGELLVTGQSDEGDCAEDDWAEDDWAGEVDGTVTALAADGSSLTVAPDDGSETATIPVDDASLLDGIEVGDEVAVILGEDGTAIDVELLDWPEDSGDEGDEGDE